MNMKFVRTWAMLALVMVIGMSVTGGTIAWFTDNVESSANVIQAGNLDVDVYFGNSTDKNSIQGKTELFDSVKLWEPGAVAWENLTVANLGTLALKYELSMNATNFNSVKLNDVEVEGSDLTHALKVGFVDGGITVDSTKTPAEARAAVLSKVSNWSTFSDFKAAGALNAGASSQKAFGVVVYWQPTTEDNKWNVNNGKTTSDGKDHLFIDLGVKLNATQLTAETDSFGPDYDLPAHWVNTDWYTANPNATEFTIKSFEDLVGLAQIVNGAAPQLFNGTANTRAAAATVVTNDTFEGKTIKLAADINLNNIDWTPIGRIGTTSTDFTYAFKGTFDGQGHTISNLDVSNEGWAGLFGLAYKATIKDVKIKDVNLYSNRMTGAVVGQLYGSIEDCHVENVKIKVVPNADESGKYDNGDKVGGIVGWIGDNNNNHHLTGCSAKNVEITAYRDIGGIAGYVAWSTTIENNTVTDIKLVVDQITNFYGEKDANANLIWGRNSESTAGVGVNAKNNTEAGENSITETYEKDGCALKKDGITGETVLKSVAASASGTVNVPEGVTTIGGYAFANNSEIDKIVLPSSVTTLNDRAFRDTSASTVVLNEGLTNISYQAFRNALNVTSVEIPSTVTTISKEAFQNSGITSLTIPANVTTIEYGGCRDMKLLEEVTIEGNVDIPVYAFRDCTRLKTVTLKGNNVTFGGGSKGMIFTNKENGDGSAITVYVANETVKERLLAADTAAKDYGGYKIIVMTDSNNE